MHLCLDIALDLEARSVADQDLRRSRLHQRVSKHLQRATLLCRQRAMLSQQLPLPLLTLQAVFAEDA